MKTQYTNTTPESKMIGDTKVWGKTEKVQRVVDDLMTGASPELRESLAEVNTKRTLKERRPERQKLTQGLRSGNPARRAEAEKALGTKGRKK